MTPNARILVVEDEAIVALDIQRELDLLGYEVVATTGDGEGAIELAAKHRPDLVLMDIRLQGAMDGVEAGRVIRAKFGIPIVFLTAHADPGTLGRAKQAEPFGYLLKPFVDQELRMAIELGLHKREVEDEAHRQADEALRQSEQRFQLLVQSLHDYAVFLLDTRGHVVSWNAGAQRIKGYAPEDILGQHFSVFYPPEEIVRNRPGSLLWAAEREGEARDEGWRVRKDGSRFWAEVLITALRDGRGQLAGFAKLTRDISERKRTEDEIRRLNSTLERKVRERTAELQAANQELEAFTYSVAHDLRGPLRGLRGFLTMLGDELASGNLARARGFLGKSEGAAERMTQLIDDLLNLCGIGRKEMRIQEVSLTELAERVKDELENENGRRNIEWRIKQLPPVKCDPGLVKQVLSNLLSNAIKYTRPHEKATITFDRGERQGQPVYFVSDNGVGFDMQHAGKLFQPFSRLHRADEFPGTGIGLAIVERIIRRHGGRVWAEGMVGQGATFYFTLGPRVVIADSPTADASPASSGKASLTPPARP